MQALSGLGLVIIVVAILFAVAPLGIWNRLIKIHRDNREAAKRTHELLERIANALEGRATRPAATSTNAAPKGPYTSRKWMS